VTVFLCPRENIGTNDQSCWKAAEAPETQTPGHELSRSFASARTLTATYLHGDLRPSYRLLNFALSGTKRQVGLILVSS
jgi:hypothetical protein